MRKRQGHRSREANIVEAVTDWVTVKKRTKQRMEQGEHEEDNMTDVRPERSPECKRRVIQIFVGMNTSKTFSLDVSLSEKVSEIMRCSDGVTR